MEKQLVKSPLEMVVQDKKPTMILEQIRDTIKHTGELLISKEDVCHVREVFSAAIEAGERRLYRFAQELTDRMVGYSPSLFLEVWGKCPQRGHREIHKTQARLAGDFHDLTDQGDSYRTALHAPFCCCDEATVSIASFVKGIVEKENPFGIRLISTRIKTPSNLAYKVADILFDIDRMFCRDKVLNQYSQVVKDVYGIKVITKDLAALQKTIQWFNGLPRHELLEAKDYLGSRKKKSGFEAYKIVIQRNRQIFEVQLQTEAMLERETIGFQENHLTYKEKQMRLRAGLGAQYEKVFKALEILLCSDGTDCREVAFGNGDSPSSFNYPYFCGGI